MEKILNLVSCSTKKQREWPRKDGTKEMVDYYEVTLTDGIDTIHGETGSQLTKQIATDGENQLRMLEGHLYSVRFNINAREYEKDGKKGNFLSINIQQMSLMV